MRVKRYVVDTLPDAVTLIRTDMGTDAVILETKEVKVGGFLGMFRKKKIEVMAAVEPSTQKKETKSSKLKSEDVDFVVEQILKASQRKKEQEMEEPTSSRQASSSSSANLSSGTASSFAARLYGTTNQTSEGNGSDHPSLEQQDTANLIAAANEKSIAVEATSDRLNQLESRLSPQSTSFSNTEQFIVNELKSLRQEMQKLSSHQINSRTLSSSIESIKLRLEEQEILDNWVELICEELIEHEIRSNEILSADAAWNFAKNKFHEWLSPYSESAISPETRIIQFVGPTGVGKTTTIAKLSANFSIKEGKKLGLITADTYRIAAVEQLRTYANILNLPLEVVFSPMDLQRAYQQLEHAQMILMDTAGRNFKSDIHVSEVNSLLQTSGHNEAVLVLSLTSRTKDMNIVAEKFSKYGVRKVVFTKLDEANAYGSIFNMVMTYGLQPIFITSGQNVPDDIDAFSAKKFVELLLGEPEYA